MTVERCDDGPLTVVEKEEGPAIADYDDRFGRLALTIGQTHFRTNVGIWQPSPAAPTRAFRRLDAPTILCIGRHHCIACHHPDALLGNCIAPTPLTSAHRLQI